MDLNFHPAPGLRALLPGWWNVPNNPIAMNAYGITRTPGIAEIVPGSFPVPQNPVRDYTTGQVKLIGSGNGCGCSGGCAGKINGMGGFTEDFAGIGAKFGAGDIMGAMQAPLLGVPLWGWAGGAVALLMFAGGSRRRR